MTSAIDYKGRTVLDEPAIHLLAIVVSTLRQHKDMDELVDDLQDARDVLTALTISGYALVPQGALEAMRRLLIENKL